MNTQKKTSFGKICILAGTILLMAAGAMLLFWQWNIRTSCEEAQEYVHMIRTLIPEPQNAVLEERRDNSMSALSLDGTDFIGMLEMPVYGSALPVCGDWGKSDRYPCCLSGSIYDGSIQIGATSQTGQYDFYREISVGDQLFFTDMSGNRYTFMVSNLRYVKHADQAALRSCDAALTLFIKNIYAFEYLVVFCDIPH